MFNDIGNFFKSAVETIKSALGIKAQAAKPASKPKPAPVVKAPAPVKNTGYQPINFTTPLLQVGNKTNQIRTQAVANNNAAAAAKSAAAAEVQRKAVVKEALRLKTQTTFDKNKSFAKAQAEKTVEQIKTNNKGDFLSWVTGGLTGEQRAREFADKQAKIQQSMAVKNYDVKYNKFLIEQTKRSAQFEKDKFTMTEAQQNKAIGIFNDWQTSAIDDLEYNRAAIEGALEGYAGKAQEAGRSPLAKIGGWIQKSVIDPVTQSPIIKYTVGSGDKNVPSIVTAPARGVTAFTNLFRKTGDTIFDKSGNTTKYNGNPWTASFNQSNLNGSAATLSFNDYARNQFLAKTNPKSVASPLLDVGKKPVAKKVNESDYNKWLAQNKDKLNKDWIDSTDRTKGTYNLANDLTLDPLTYATGGSSKVSKWLGRGSEVASDAAKATKIGSAVFKGADKLVQSKPVQWLNKEHLNFNARKNEFIQAEVADIKRKKPLVAAKVDEWMANSGKIRAKLKSEISKDVLQNYGNLSRVENRSLQELLRAGGDWSKVKYVDKFDAAGRQKIEDMVARIRKNHATQLADNRAAGINVREKNNYIPQYRSKYSMFTVKDKLTKKTGDELPPEWWFTKEQKRQSIQRRGKFLKSMSAREYSSRMANQDLPILQSIKGGRADIGENIKRIQNVGDHVKQTKWEKISAPIRKPIDVWKKSVLKYNPSWTVNNIGWNVPASALSGGPRALSESVRLLKGSNWKAAMADIPDAVKTNLANEIGSTGKLNAFYNRIENHSRVAAFRAAKSSGLDDAAALKRVNKYMFDYKTKNWERPLKAVLPFWAWNKSIAKASAVMPFDRPLAAKAYNELDRHQQTAFDTEFQKWVPQLRQLGYSDQEIADIKNQKQKFYKGRMNIGNDNWISTPFNPLSGKGQSGVGFNPYLTAGTEASLAQDSFGNKVSGKDASYLNRLTTKFPQVNLANKSIAALRVAQGIYKPSKMWIGKAGSDGTGLSKERQGYDPTKPNYDKSMDPRSSLGQSALAFLGVPGSIKFSGDELIRQKTLQKATESYFALKTKDMDFADKTAAQQAVFDKYGLTADQFYKGVLSKYDSANTQRIKGLKESAAVANKSLFEQYAAQPTGTRNVWATNKLRELNDQNYFNDNPFKKSFKYISPATIQKADKQTLVQKAIKTGDWSSYRAKYGLSAKQQLHAKATASGDWTAWESKYGRSEKALARDKALKNGDWTAYANAYGVSKKSTPYQLDGKFFKTAESMAKYKEGKFWEKYATASKSARKSLLATNPQFNHRANWTTEQWDIWKADTKAKQVAVARSWGDFAANQDRNKQVAQRSANKFLASRGKLVRVKHS